jgi:hypothetical protein
MKTVIFLLLTAIASSVHAEIFKCKLATGKIEYQPTPCPQTTVDQQVIEIKKEDPRRLAEAQARFKAWQAEQEVVKEKELKEAKERQAELDRKESVNALKRSAIAQEQQAAAAAAAAAQQPVIINNFVTPRRHFVPHAHDQHNSNDMPVRHNDIDANERPGSHDRLTSGR